MAKGDRVDEGETVLRALHEPFWDLQKWRLSTSAFAKREVSVARLQVLGLAELCAIFRKSLDRTPEEREGPRAVSAVGKVTVGQVKVACLSPEPPAARALAHVEEDAIEAENGLLANPAHAVIRAYRDEPPHDEREITRAMATAIIRCCLATRTDDALKEPDACPWTPVTLP